MLCKWLMEMKQCPVLAFSNGLNDLKRAEQFVETDEREGRPSNFVDYQCRLCPN